VKATTKPNNAARAHEREEFMSRLAQLEKEEEEWEARTAAQSQPVQAVQTAALGASAAGSDAERTVTKQEELKEVVRLKMADELARAANHATQAETAFSNRVVEKKPGPPKKREATPKLQSQVQVKPDDQPKTQPAASVAAEAPKSAFVNSVKEREARPPKLRQVPLSKNPKA
jgi:hypothetical protein